MYLCSMYSKELFKGTLSTVILKLLSENEKMYGYEITKRVEELSEGEISIKEGSLYPALHKLENKKIIEAHYENIGNRVRKYYSLTKEGESFVTIKIEEYKSFIKTINKILQPNIV